MTHEEKALELMAERKNCAQAVLGAFAPELGLTEEQAMGVSFAFFSGMRKAEVCGACSGALMVLGMLYGQKKADDMEARAKGIAVEERFLDLFASENGSYLCREILHYDISKPDEAEKARNEGLFGTVCPNVVAKAVRIVEKIMAEN